MERNILRFDSYFKNNTINESAASLKAVSEIISAFFKLYTYLDFKGPLDGTLKVKEFADAKDADKMELLSKIGAEKDNSKRADLMKQAIDSVSNKLTDSFASIKPKATEVSTKLAEVFKYATSNEAAKAGAAEIEKSIQDTIKMWQNKIKSFSQERVTVENRNYEMRKNVLMYESFNYSYMYEKKSPKVVLKDERNSIVAQIDPIYTEMMVQQKTPVSPGMKSKADEAINKFNEISSMLNNDEAWNKMNRRERKTKIEEISNQVRDIISKVAEFQKKEIANLGMDKKTSDDLLSVITDINSIIKDIAKIEKTMSYKAEEEEAKKYKVGDKVKTHPDENGDFMEGEVTKIEGTQITIKRKDGKEITKSANSIESKSENKKETLKLEKTIKATGKKPNKKYNEASKKVFEMICKKFEKDEKISGMKQWKKAEFCSPRFYTIGPNRTAIIKAIKLGFGLNDKTADLTQEFIDKLSS
jgi:hypothetical protein